MKRIAVLGAGGFIGNRIVERFVLGGNAAEIVPIVRQVPALALASRFKLQGRIADAFDEGALGAALEGCTVLVCAIAGDLKTIVDTVRPVYAAAERAGVARIVYLSSAMVHGQAPAPGTDERTPLSLRQPLPYNRAKVRAERELRRLCEAGRTEVVILRPGIVYGPRSQWTGGLADNLLSRRAFLADGGRGICNAIYIDNLVHAILLAIDAKGVNGEAFLVNDSETVSWRDLAAPIAKALGISLDQIAQPSSADLIAKSSSVQGRLIVPAARALVALLPKRVAEAQRAARRVLRRSDFAAEPEPQFAREWALLHACRVRLPSTKAEQMLGYHPPVSFDEGCRRSVEWLRFAAYPVR